MKPSEFEWGAFKRLAALFCLGSALSKRHFLLRSCFFYSSLALILPSGAIDTNPFRRSQPLYILRSKLLVCLFSQSVPHSAEGNFIILAPLPLDQFHGSLSLLKCDLWKEKQHSSFRSLGCNPENVLIKPQVESAEQNHVASHIWVFYFW